MTGELTDAVEARLQHLGPGTSEVIISTQRGKSTTQVSRRQDVEFLAQPTGRATVVGDGDHSSEPVCEPPQGTQRHGQPVSTAEGRDNRQLRGG